MQNLAPNLEKRTNELVAHLDPIQHLSNLDYPRRAGTEGAQRLMVVYLLQAREDGN